MLIIDCRENISALISDFIRQASDMPCHCTNNEFVGLIECAWVVNRELCNGNVYCFRVKTVQKLTFLTLIRA